MNKTWCCLFLIVFSITSAFSQTISKTWQFQTSADTLIEKNVFGDANELQFSEGQFNFLKDTDTLASGDYMYQNDVLVLFYNTPEDTMQNLRVSELTDSTMSVKSRNSLFNLKVKDQEVKEVIPAQVAKEMIPSQGISTSSILRGIFGMLALLIIAFLFSSNRKAINWKTVGLGLGAQLILAIGVLKITFVQKIFEFVGKGFVKILEFTAAGSEFLLGGMMDVDSFGFIFLF